MTTSKPHKAYNPSRKGVFELTPLEAELVASPTPTKEIAKALGYNLQSLQLMRNKAIRKYLDLKQIERDDKINDKRKPDNKLSLAIARTPKFRGLSIG